MIESTDSTLRVLLIEDSEDDAELILRTLRKAGYRVEHNRVDERDGLLAALEKSGWEIVICDYSMPRLTGLEALQIVKESGLDLPFIVVSGAIGEDVAVDVMKAGAFDYLMKNNLKRLVPAIQRELREAEQRKARRIAEQTLRYRAYHDALTGLPNRWLLQDRLAQAVAFARREQRMVGLFFADLDRFKEINDTLGHLVGDQLLRAVSSRLVNLLREGDTIARLSGDEFGLLLADLHSEKEGQEIADRLLNALEPAFQLADREVHVGASVGIAVFPKHGGDAETLLKHAEFAMYHAKGQGRKHVQFYTADVHAAAHERFYIEHDLHQAIEQNMLELHYQPQVNLSTGTVIGVEALVRWNHPRNGLIPPIKFIPVAEETGLIVQLGEWVFKRAVKDYCSWLEKGIELNRLAINLSVKQIHQSDTVPLFSRVLGEHPINPEVVEFEITESSIMQDPERVLQVVSAVRDMGSSVAIDDFGTGYSSLSQLRRLPFDVLKIDRSFVRDIAIDTDDAAIVSAILAMARNLGLTVIAEGVENQAQELFLCEHQCPQGQGFLYSKPLPNEQLLEFLIRSQGIQSNEASA